MSNVLRTQEIARDNQWWFKKSPMFQAVIEQPFIELIVEGRSCLLERSNDGTDGRATYSFKFLRDDDRQYWRSLNGRVVQLELGNLFSHRPTADDDMEDEFFSDNAELTPEEPGPDQGSKCDEPYSNCRVELHSPCPLFDAYIFVDWSANNRQKTGKDSIWIAEAYWKDGFLFWPQHDRGCLNAPTRQCATEYVQRSLANHLQQNRRALICFDFAYGYPECDEFKQLASDNLAFARCLSSGLDDDDCNRNNRFELADSLNKHINPESGEGPFWGRPTSGRFMSLDHLRATKPKDWDSRTSLKEFRVVEERLCKHGRRAFSVWQLFGNGSVGSQVLVGLPRVFGLRNLPSFADFSRIWPFETGWVTEFDETVQIIHAEFWPGAIDIDESLHPVRDAAQVKSCAIWAAKHDSAGSLGGFFDPLSESDIDRGLAQREGWILGFVDK